MTRDFREPYQPRLEEPAAVVNDEGTWGRARAPYRPPQERSGAGAVWWVGALLALTGALWVAALSLSQVSSRPVAIPAIEQGVAAITEVDALLVIHQHDLCDLAAADVPVDILGFPISGLDVGVSDIHCTGGALDAAALRSLLLTTSAEHIYVNGADAFLADDNASQTASALSASGGIRQLISTLGAGTHDQMTVAAQVLGALNAVLLLGVVLLGRGVRRFAGAGLVILVAAFPTLAVALLAWVFLGTMDSGSGITAQFAQIARSLAEVPLRNAVWLSVCGLALLLPALLLDHLIRRARNAQWWEYSR